MSEENSIDGPLSPDELSEAHAAEVREAFNLGYEEGQGIRPVYDKPYRSVTLVSSTLSWVFALVLGLLIPLFFNGVLANVLNSFQPMTVIPEPGQGIPLEQMRKATAGSIAALWSIGVFYLIVIIYQVRVLATAVNWVSAAAALLFTIAAPVGVTVVLPLVVSSFS